jgi:hypothetical protein
MAALLQNQLGLNVRGNLINCWFVLDNSGSMAGSKWTLARYPFVIAGGCVCFVRVFNLSFVSFLLPTELVS